jgi:hypothetical protein
MSPDERDRLAMICSSVNLDRFMVRFFKVRTLPSDGGNRGGQVTLGGDLR